MSKSCPPLDDALVQISPLAFESGSTNTSTNMGTGIMSLATNMILRGATLLSLITQRDFLNPNHFRPELLTVSIVTRLYSSFTGRLPVTSGEKTIEYFMLSLRKEHFQLCMSFALIVSSMRMRSLCPKTGVTHLETFLYHRPSGMFPSQTPVEMRICHCPAVQERFRFRRRPRA